MSLFVHMKHLINTKLCNCKLLIARIEDQCMQCKIDYIEWVTGKNQEELKDALYKLQLRKSTSTKSSKRV